MTRFARSGSYLLFTEGGPTVLYNTYMYAITPSPRNTGNQKYVIVGAQFQQWSYICLNMFH